MVTVLRSGGFRVIIFVDDHEPAHVHVFEDGHAQLNLVPEPALVFAEGMTRSDVRKAMKLVLGHRDALLIRWKEIHG